MTGRAIDALVAALERSTVEAVSRGDILEALDELRGEVHKDRPNRIRFSSLANGVAIAIQTAGAARDAYEVFRTALLGWGIQVPAWQ